MLHTTRQRLTAAGLATAALVAGAAIGHARMPADLATAQPTVAHTARPVPSEVPTVAEAERWYYTHLGPSVAWQHATQAERAHAERSYLADWEGGEGCHADLVHAYQGTKAHHTWAQPSLLTHTANGSDLLLAEYTDGICGD